jgi:hypothetical protein
MVHGSRLLIAALFGRFAEAYACFDINALALAVLLLTLFPFIVLAVRVKWVPPKLSALSQQDKRDWFGGVIGATIPLLGISILYVGAWWDLYAPGRRVFSTWALIFVVAPVLSFMLMILGAILGKYGARAFYYLKRDVTEGPPSHGH